MNQLILGDIYFWIKNFPLFMKESSNRFYKLLSVTETHVFLQNIRLGGTYNVSINNFKNDYEHWKRKVDVN